MHFGENQLSPGSIGISPLPTGHPPVLQHWWVRASTRSYPRFTLPMGSSPGFGSYPGNTTTSRPLQTRFRSGSGALPHLNLPLPPSRKGGRCCQHTLAGSFYKRHAVRRLAGPKPTRTLPSDCLSVQGFRGSFIPLLGVLFTFPSRYWFTIGGQEYARLGGWSPQLPTGFLVPRGTQVQSSHNPMVRLSATGLSPAPVGLPRPFA